MKTLLLLFLLVSALLRPSTSLATAPTVQYANGRLTADLRDVELTDVLAAVAAQGSLEIKGTPTPRTISMKLDAVPLADALPRLLEGQSFALTYDRSGGLKGVRFLGASTSMPTPTPTPAPVGDHPSDPPAGTDLETAPATNRPVPIEGQLAGAVGADQSTFYQLMGVALQVGDARVRRDALRICLRLINTDPDLRAEILRAVEGVDDEFLANRLMAVSRANAQEIAERTARSLRSKSLRRRAIAVEELIRPSAPPGAGG
jgi:hypothetical protein